ncbi:divergent polysaccharide deacetylase family protein [Paenibacillus sp. N3/727]|uniref:divergent polysaccharide deacetylase family protein n=1 Tax=Paenibacillus sp. N3/727 TaxID=2925845 RepID=UPI001F52DEC4|nr:divergent polysaccharide deacetylase family protein [Paenibacillus sp. N3/727]UNK17038.1 divergent polysaccharide deacetylase family protein [Paenibacillus sp. N3/727]
MRNMGSKYVAAVWSALLTVLLVGALSVEVAEAASHDVQSLGHEVWWLDTSAGDMKSDTRSSLKKDSVRSETAKQEKESTPGNKLAVIIDDFGNGQKGTDEILNLPIKITVAVMPFLPTSKSDAERAHKLGHDVIIHMPMEPKQGRANWLGPGAITSKMTDEEIRKQLEKAIDHVPFAVGMNNHMGSKITGDERIMSIVLDVCKERGLFFIDSKTNYHSVTSKLAAEKGMPNINNEIFLDDVHTVKHVTKQLKAAAEQAVQNKSCITIGHVGTFGDRTAAALKGSIPELQRQVQFVGIQELVQDRSNWRPDPVLSY